MIQPRLRVIVRPLLIAGSLVIVAGSLVAGYWLYTTSEEYQRRADQHAQEAAVHEANSDSLEPPYGDAEKRKAQYHSQMNKKWEYAAFHPWLPVEPDLPRPK